MTTCGICGRTLGSAETTNPQYHQKGIHSVGLSSVTVICNDCSIKYPNACVQKER